MVGTKLWKLHKPWTENNFLKSEFTGKIRTKKKLECHKKRLVKNKKKKCID